MFVVCFDCVLYTPGPIPVELGKLANLRELDLEGNKLTGIPYSLFPVKVINLREEACFPYALSYQSDSVTCCSIEYAFVPVG